MANPTHNPSLAPGSFRSVSMTVLLSANSPLDEIGNVNFRSFSAGVALPSSISVSALRLRCGDSQVAANTIRIHKPGARSIDGFLEETVPSALRGEEAEPYVFRNPSVRRKLSFNTEGETENDEVPQLKVLKTRNPLVTSNASVVVEAFDSGLLPEFLERAPSTMCYSATQSAEEALNVKIQGVRSQPVRIGSNADIQPQQAVFEDDGDTRPQRKDPKRFHQHRASNSTGNILSDLDGSADPDDFSFDSPGPPNVKQLQRTPSAPVLSTQWRIGPEMGNSLRRGPSFHLMEAETSASELKHGSGLNRNTSFDTSKALRSGTPANVCGYADLQADTLRSSSEVPLSARIPEAPLASITTSSEVPLSSSREPGSGPGHPQSTKTALGQRKLQATSKKNSGNHPQTHPQDNSNKPSDIQPHALPTLLGYRPSPKPHNSSNHSSYRLEQDVLLQRAKSLAKLGSHMESAYHFRLAAERGSTEAMLLYAKCLCDGKGVRKNHSDSFIWLCKCASSEDMKPIGFLVNPRTPQCEVMVDPMTLKLSLESTRTPHHKTYCKALYNIGIYVLNGWGVPRDELEGARFLELSASFGDVEAMTHLGENVWSQKKAGKRKKDLKRAACWLRLAESCGANLIGQSWIHEDKYVK
ncbi:hypothetical protein BABINDRAFT_165539 [Babjeviella inositovora NRRL Y-12698]|uniref:Uncharacterized protein n=1 Tax=Babjeviella inositovora NRRL Y-12698 TaxID=984486 RepID=A0A1E3QY60_9ASCO|nr:uncharacterized protein BABINDRAFT_165539 [Babjeviella inositovora NRRL Y-12698]ODQ82042.1 hypothetical protein BABINDRAFT_165539 [Babjeviella inositovora NRRL Y-12698]